MKEELLKLQEAIYQQELIEEEYFVEDSAKLYFFPIGNFFDLYFYGNGYDDFPHTRVEDFEENSNIPFCLFLEFICKQEYANRIVSLTFNGADEGANGTKNWDFSRIVNSDVLFPNLKQLSVQLSDLGDHNFNIIGQDYDEDGMIAKLLSKMPNLETLIVPSAPNKLFFDIENHPLRYLKVQAGYDNQSFIKNLAQSDNFRHLSSLDFTDFMDTNNAATDDFVPFEDFKALFISKAFSMVKRFVLRNSILTKEQLLELQRINKNIQFLYVDAKGGQYVSNMEK